MSGPFQRTVCACVDCLACCERQPGYLIPDDLPAIADLLGEPVEPFLVASPGALIGRVTDGVGFETFRVGTIVPRTTTPGGRCIFLESDGRCAIHSVAPFGCAMFDTHMADEVWQERSMWGIGQIMASAYQAKRGTLSLAKTYNPR